MKTRPLAGRFAASVGLLLSSEVLRRDRQMMNGNTASVDQCQFPQLSADDALERSRDQQSKKA
jgi:hypothetical protein